VALEAVIAANRFGLGARPGELQRIGSGARAWLETQVKGAREAPEAIRGLPSSAQVFRAYAQGLMERRDARQQGAATRDPAASLRQTVAPIYLDQVAARYRVAARTEESFRERLVHFWTNHFAVSADKAQVIALAATLENEAIRPNIAGRFAELLLAVEAHPAMILYLDNQASIGPNSTLAQRAARRAAQGTGGPERRRGINENLAREILELHTLGVDGGYTQTDVTAFAHALTGWAIAGNRGGQGPGRGEPGTFEFRELVHEPGAKTILGKRYAQDGVDQPRAVLLDLAKHPSTARHIATKLVRHFVADDPPGTAVEHVAKAFRDSEGDLPTVHRALIACADAWSAIAVKLKTPHEFAVSTLRMLDRVPDQPQQIIAPFQLLGQRPYTPGSPAGWPDTAGHWDGADALLRRIEWASSIGERIGPRAQPLQLAAQSLGEALTERTRTAISRAASAAQGVALLLASPEFQRR
jgi:uncharacterized protein (DUF1800 family)